MRKTTQHAPVTTYRTATSQGRPKNTPQEKHTTWTKAGHSRPHTTQTHTRTACKSSVHATTPPFPPKYPCRTTESHRPIDTRCLHTLAPNVNITATISVPPEQEREKNLEDSATTPPHALHARTYPEPKKIQNPTNSSP